MTQECHCTAECLIFLRVECPGSRRAPSKQEVFNFYLPNKNNVSLGAVSRSGVTCCETLLRGHLMQNSQYSNSQFTQSVSLSPRAVRITAQSWINSCVWVKFVELLKRRDDRRGRPGRRTGAVWSVLAPHTIGTTLLNAPVDFRCSNTGTETFSNRSRSSREEFITTTLAPDEEDSTDEVTEESELTTTSSPDISWINSSASTNKTSSKYGNKCLKFPPLHLLPGIYDTDNNSWAVDDHGSLHQLDDGEEEMLRDAAKGGHLVEYSVPSCPHVEYDDSTFTVTIATEWNLICERMLLRPLFQNTYTLGTMVGCIIGGDIGDRFGRVTAIRMGALLHMMASLAVAFTTNFTVLLVARFLVGLTNLGILVTAVTLGRSWSEGAAGILVTAVTLGRSWSEGAAGSLVTAVTLGRSWSEGAAGSFVTAVTLALETCPAHLRGAVGMGVGLPYSVGVMLFGGLGYVLRSWRHLYMASSFPAFLMVPVSFMLDESPRWLLQNTRVQDAHDILRKAAKANKGELPSDQDLNKILLEIAKTETNEGEKEVKPKSFRERLQESLNEIGSFVRTPAMRVISVVTPINWVFSEIIYYGIIFNANNFAGSNPFAYVALTGVSDAVAIIIGAPVSNYIGRRNAVGAAQFFAGLLTILVLAVPDSVRWLQWVLVMAGFLMSAAAAQILYVFTPELYPTTLRARGFAFCNLTGYAGAFFALYIPEVFATLGWWVTNTILGSAGMLGGIIIFLLPETNNKVLCETAEDVELRAKLKKEKRKEKKAEKLKLSEKKAVTAEDITHTVPSESTLKNGHTSVDKMKSGNLSFLGLKTVEEELPEKESDASIVRRLVFGTPINPAPCPLSSVKERSYSSSINCLLESPGMLSTDSFGTKNSSPFVQPIRRNISGRDNAAFVTSESLSAGHHRDAEAQR
ncbi:Major facilitator sugar transporter-like [Trinorchestia longiramus]|nr:Major facilitator sugar transporter-like [Trinorchestia longiramus]